MSIPLRSMAQSERQGEIRADVQNRSSFGVKLVLRRSGPISRPVDLAFKLKAFGLGLSAAHKALNRIVADEAVRLDLSGADRATMIADLAELGVSAE